MKRRAKKREGERREIKDLDENLREVAKREDAGNGKGKDMEGEMKKRRGRR